MARSRRSPPSCRYSGPSRSRLTQRHALPGVPWCHPHQCGVEEARWYSVYWGDVLSEVLLRRDGLGEVQASTVPLTAALRTFNERGNRMGYW